MCRGGAGKGGRREEFSRCMNFSGTFLPTLNNFSDVGSLSWAAERGRQSEGTIAGLCNDSDCSEGSKGMTNTLNVATKKFPRLL